MRDPAGLRVAFVGGSLRLGGAEKQLWYQARALHERGVTVRVFSARPEGEAYTAALDAAGIPVASLGRSSLPPLRLLHLVRRLREFRPHVVQASHAFMNLYAAAAARVLGAISLGALRGSLRRCAESNGLWTPWLMRGPTALAVNSRRSRDELAHSGLVKAERVHVLENAIDLQTYRPDGAAASAGREVVVVFVGTLAPVKRGDLFLEALSEVRQRRPEVRGIVVGTGPDLPALRHLASRTGLANGGVEFVGARDDVPALLRQADALVLCSDDEGTPNVVMEAMASGLPVVTTPAGDAPALVEDGVSGFVVPFGDARAIAEKLSALAASPQERRRLGDAGRQRIARSHGIEHLAERLLAIYRSVATSEERRELLAALEAASS